MITIPIIIILTLGLPMFCAIDDNNNIRSHSSERYLLIKQSQSYKSPPVYYQWRAKELLYLSAGAYALKDQEKLLCVQRAFVRSHWRLLTSTYKECDYFNNNCHFYIVASNQTKELVVAFRGTASPSQLVEQIWSAATASYKMFHDICQVSSYFYNAFNVLWKNGLQKVLLERDYKDYTVTFTGHSLGGAMASLASARTILEKLRTDEQVRLYTFGQPCVGPFNYARWHNVHISHSFRIVNANDIVPHLFGCSNKLKVSNPRSHLNSPHIGGQNKRNKQDDEFKSTKRRKIKRQISENEISKNGTMVVDPVLDALLDEALKDFENFEPLLKSSPNCQRCQNIVHDAGCILPKQNLIVEEGGMGGYHHGTEIWYPDGMNMNRFFNDYKICRPETGHDSCSKPVTVSLSPFVMNEYFENHRYYFGVKVSEFGNSGCSLKPPITF